MITSNPGFEVERKKNKKEKEFQILILRLIEMHCLCRSRLKKRQGAKG